MNLRLDEIRIGQRVRKEMGDIKALAESINRQGLLQPIVVLSDHTLVIGQRRIAAAAMLGWEEIPVTVLDVDDLLSAERDENEIRKDFTPSEAVAIGRLIEETHRKKIERQKSAMGRQSVAKREGYQVPKQDEVAPLGKTSVVAARAVGMGASKYEQAKEVVAAAEIEPETFGDLPAQMDKTGNVKAAHREMKHRRAGTSGRHAVHYKKHRPKADQMIERAVTALDGICIGLEEINAKEATAEKAEAWAESLQASAAAIRAFARRLKG